MEFQVARNRKQLELVAGEYIAFLKPNDWDDYGFRTHYTLELVSKEDVIEIGHLAIAYEGMGRGLTNDELPKRFEALPADFFSLGLNDEYYWNLKQAGDECRDKVLQVLGDLALDINRFEKLLENSGRTSVIRQSFLRHTSQELVVRQFHRLAKGGPRFLGFDMSFSVDYENCDQLDFFVRPESCPPSNVHALIGSNGVGKTHLSLIHI